MLNPHDPTPELNALQQAAATKDLVKIQAALADLAAKPVGHWRNRNWKLCGEVCTEIRQLWLEREAWDAVAEAHVKYYFCGVNALDVLRPVVERIPDAQLCRMMALMEFPEELAKNANADGLVMQLVSRPAPAITDFIVEWLSEAGDKYLTGAKESWEEHRTSTISPIDRAEVAEEVMGRALGMLARRAAVDGRVPGMMRDMLRDPPWGVNRWVTIRLINDLMTLPNREPTERLILELLEQVGNRAPLYPALLGGVAAFDPNRALRAIVTDLRETRGERELLERLDQFEQILEGPGGNPDLVVLERHLGGLNLSGWSILCRGRLARLLRARGLNELPQARNGVAAAVYMMVNLFWIIRYENFSGLNLFVFIFGFIYSNLLDLVIGRLISPWGWWEFYLFLSCAATMFITARFAPDRAAHPLVSIAKGGFYWGMITTYLLGSIWIHWHVVNVVKPGLVG